MFEWVGVVLFAVGTGGALFFALAFAESLSRKQRVYSQASLALFFFGLALFGAFAYSYAAYAEPVECDGLQNLVYWRELRVYNATRIHAAGNETVYLSFFNLAIENQGNDTISNARVTEHIPETVAADAARVFNFTVPPLIVENESIVERLFGRGGVAVELSFNEFKPGEKKTVSYAVEKRLYPDVLKDFGVPNVVAQEVSSCRAAAAQAASVDWLVPALAAAVAVIGALARFLAARRKRGKPE